MTAGNSSADPAISIDRLTVRFGAQSARPVLAVDDVSLQIAQGEFVSLVGPSGCGKTTILNLLTGLLVEPWQGRVHLMGKVPAPGNPALSYMLARDCLFPWRTALQNASYGMELRKVDPAVRDSRARDLLARVGLGDFIDKYPKALSHGMRQRCALARTFALDAPVLLMDEPFGALDAQTKLQLEDLLLGLWSEHRRTVVFVTHDLAEAVAMSDRVVVMCPRPGRILADVRIDLERPRSIRALQQDRRFHEIYSHIWGLLESGVAKDEK